MSTPIALLNPIITSIRMKVSSISNMTIIKRNLFKILKASQVKPLSINSLKNLRLNMTTEKISLSISTLVWVEEVEAVGKHLNINWQKHLQVKTITKRWSTSTTAILKSLLTIWVSNMEENNSQRASSWYKTKNILSTPRKEKRNSLRCWNLTSNQKTWYAASWTSAHLTW